MSRPSTPSSHQEAIVRFAIEGTGHGVIMATAGSGKSTTLVEVAHRLPEGTRACFLAFNTSAAQQLKARLPAHVTARTIHALGLRTLASAVKGRELARVYPRKYQELVKARLRNTEESYRVSSQTASQAVHYLRELTHYARVNLAQGDDRGVLERLARTYHLRPPEQPELVNNLHTQLWEILRDGVTLAPKGLYDYTDMIYAPLVADLSPTQRYNMVCVDEAQDLSHAALLHPASPLPQRQTLVRRRHQAVHLRLCRGGHMRCELDRGTHPGHRADPSSDLSVSAEACAACTAVCTGNSGCAGSCRRR